MLHVLIVLIEVRPPVGRQTNATMDYGICLCSVPRFLFKFSDDE